jgi:cytochrome b561
MTNKLYSYTPAQRGFHWAMAAILILAIGLGLVASQLTPGTSPRVELLYVHKSLGMAALVLLPLRFVVRLIAGEPAWRVAPTPLVRAAAHGAHVLLYALMALLPLSGYVTSVAGGHSAPFFGLFRWPALVAKDKPLSDAADVLHHYTGWAIAALVAVHVLAALWHRLQRDEVFSRMAPAASKR